MRAAPLSHPAEIPRRAVDRVLRLGDQLLDLVVGDGERWRADHRVAHGAHDEAAAEAIVAAMRADIARLGEEAALGLLGHELDGAEQAAAAHLADERMALEGLAHAALEMRPHLA